jgi:ribonuclease Z
LQAPAIQGEPSSLTRDTIDYHTTPAEAAGIADETHLPLLVLTRLVPPLPNALMRT